MAATTFFASAARSEAPQLLEQHQAVHQAAFITAVLQAMPDMVMVLNQHRQIIAANQRLLDMLGMSEPSLLIGNRPGEAIGCIHCSEGPNGCGTSEKCSGCGAVMTILASQQTGKQAVGECRIVIGLNGGTALDLEAMATPLEVGGLPLTIFALKDISAEKRRQVLERTFFHDILNTVSGIKGIAELLASKESLPLESEKRYRDWMVELAENLAEEINQQRRLLAAERGEYVPEMEQINLRDMLQEVCRLYSNHTRTADRNIILEDSPQCYLVSDKPMLRRIVGNMILNALEAIPAGGTVRVSLANTAGNLRIMVTNPGEMPLEVQLRLFKRSFSTKAATGRGIGTYSMKLFGERYLGGKVGFRCQDGETQFFIEFNRPE